MKEVLRHVFEGKRSHQRLPLFEWMRNQQLGARQRLAFFPAMAPFMMGFEDLNGSLLREDRPGDLLQDLVNSFTHDHDGRWARYLEDFATLGFDIELRGTEWMKFLASDDTRGSRVLLTRLTALVSGTTSIERLAIIAALDEASACLLGAMRPLSAVIEEQLGEPLGSCAAIYSDREENPVFACKREAMASIALTDYERARCRTLVHEVYQAFEAWADELLRYALAHPTPAQRGDYTVRSSATWRIGGEVEVEVEPTRQSG
jgi:hypothetical protein